MQTHPQRVVTLSNLGFCIIVGLAALGWMVATYLVGKIPALEPLKLFSELGMEALKALFIGTAAAIAVDRYLRHAFGETPEAVLQRFGIKHIYPSRQTAASDLIRLVDTSKNLQMIGVSLRDFLRDGGVLQDVWKRICSRLDEEQKLNKAVNERLHVRILLLDPKSSEGEFRHRVEREAIGGAGLPFDVPQGLEAVSVAQQTIFRGSVTPFLQVRLYEHCPFAFVFLADTEALVEQYDYRDQSKRAALPLIVYENGTPQYSELQYSVKTIWEHAGPADLSLHHVRTARAITGARLRNIFRRYDRHLLADRQTEAIKTSADEDTVDILAITGRFYCTYPVSDTIRRIARGGEGRKPALVRFALVNPVSQ